MHNQIDRVTIPWLSLPHTSHHFLTLLAIENVLCKYMGQSVWAQIIKSYVKGVVLGGCRVVGGKGETWVVGVFVLLLFIHLIIVDG